MFSSSSILVIVLLIVLVAIALIFGLIALNHSKALAKKKISSQRFDDYHIQFDSVLIDKLKDDHQLLITLFTEINQSLDGGHFHNIPELLRRFDTALQEHVLTENIKFYVYLQNKFSHDPVTTTHLSDVRREMNRITRSVVKFINLHMANPPTGENAAQFKQDLGGIGEVLIKRVSLEEGSLYPMYS